MFIAWYCGIALQPCDWRLSHSHLAGVNPPIRGVPHQSPRVILTIIIIGLHRSRPLLGVCALSHCGAIGDNWFAESQVSAPRNENLDQHSNSTEFQYKTDQCPRELLAGEVPVPVGCFPRLAICTPASLRVKRARSNVELEAPKYEVLAPAGARVVLGCCNQAPPKP